MGHFENCEIHQTHAAKNIAATELPCPGERYGQFPEVPMTSFAFLPAKPLWLIRARKQRQHIFITELCEGAIIAANCNQIINRRQHDGIIYQLSNAR